MTDNLPKTLNCPSCGAPLDYNSTSSIVRCKFCKNIALIPGLPAAQEVTPRAALDEVRLLAQNGDLIGAIRRYRELYGVGLKEAKDAVDALAANKIIEVHRAFSGPLSAEETGRALDEVKEMLRSGNKIAAIKHYRELNDVSLNQAKDVIDQVEASLTGIPLPPRPGIAGSASDARPAVRVLRAASTIAFAIILVVTIGGLTFFLSGGGSAFGPRLNSSEPVVLAASAPGTPPDVAALFYNIDADNRLIGLVDGSTGKLRWQAAALPGDGYADAIADGGDLVYAASGTSLLAYRKIDGSLAWSAQMPDKLNYGASSLLVTGGRVITNNVDQSIQAYDALSGRPAWNRRLAGYDRSLRLMSGSLAVLDYPEADSYTYSLFLLDPVDGKQQRRLTPACQNDQNYPANLDLDSGLVYIEQENALYLIFDSSYGCVQRLDFTTGQVTWQSSSFDSFGSSPEGFNALVTDTRLYFANGSQLLAVDKATGAIKTLLDNADYDSVPLAVTGDTLLVRARRTRGTEKFELWGLDPASGAQLWQVDLKGAIPIDPPNEMAGMVDDTDTGFTWKLASSGLVLIKFEGNPNQLVLDTFNPTDGTLLGEVTVPMKLVVGDFYTIPTVIGWRGDLIYLNLDSIIYALDVTTGKIVFHY